MDFVHPHYFVYPSGSQLPLLEWVTMFLLISREVPLVTCRGLELENHGVQYEQNLGHPVTGRGIRKGPSSEVGNKGGQMDHPSRQGPGFHAHVHLIMAQTRPTTGSIAINYGERRQQYFLDTNSWLPPNRSALRLHIYTCAHVYFNIYIYIFIFVSIYI